MKKTILLVDDEPSITESLKRALRREPYEFLTAQSAEQALEVLKERPVDAVIADEHMPGMTGSQLISLVRKKYPDTLRIILTGHPELDSCIRAINQGEVYRFFTKPFHEVDLAITLRQALQQKDLIIEVRNLLEAARSQLGALEQLERDHPGITQVKLDARGAVVIDPVQGDLESLVAEMRKEVQRYKRYFPKREDS